MSDWDQICDYLLKSEECEGIHKIMWPSEGWGYISGYHYGKDFKPVYRVRVDRSTNFYDVKRIVMEIKSMRK